MTDLLEVLWPLVDAAEPVISQTLADTWPSGVHGWLLEMSMLRQVEDAQQVLCPECHGHVSDVIVRDGPGGKPRFFTPCPVVHRAEIPPNSLRRWAVNLDGLTMTLAATMGLSGRPKTILSNRLWRLGRTSWQGAMLEVMFARGLGWADGQIVRSSIVRAHRPIIFVADRRPPADFWRKRRPPVLALSHIASLANERLEIDPMEIAAAIGATEATKAGPEVDDMSAERLKLMIRQQIKAEEATSLTDAVLTAAYRQHGSVREAALFLSQETNQEVSKDKVNRAIQRAGGAKAVLNNEDSDSIRRRVVSQHRDRTRKTLHSSKPVEE